MFCWYHFFGRSGEIANQYLRKGSKILVEGRLVLEQWVDQSGQKRSKHSVVAERVQFMDSKAAGADDNISAAKEQLAPQPQMQQQKNNEIPSIDIDEDEIPF